VGPEKGSQTTIEGRIKVITFRGLGKEDPFIGKWGNGGVRGQNGKRGWVTEFRRDPMEEGQKIHSKCGGVIRGV